MEWSTEQQAALIAVDAWLGSGDAQVFRLFGYAGTGKTTLAKHLAQRCDGPVRFAAFTGKAASVLRGKGCEAASTLHSLIYVPQEKSRLHLKQLEADRARCVATQAPAHEICALDVQISLEQDRLKHPAFALNPDSELLDCRLLIVDEVSMVDERMAEDILSFGTKVLALGDPGQLPPVRGSGYFTNAEPDVMLNHVHRQACESPIIQLATHIRTGGVLEPRAWTTEEAQVRKSRGALCDWPDDSIHRAAEFDQILVGRNATRRTMNQRVRNALGFSGDMPQAGEKIVCLRNDKQTGLLNGGLWRVQERLMDDPDRVWLHIANEDGAHLEVECHRHFFEDRESQLDHYMLREAQCFDFGYALTTHKAQGSEWPAVLIVDESSCFRGQETRWLYTAVTRASERVTIVQW